MELYDVISQLANYLLTVFHQNLLAVILFTILMMLVYIACEKYGFIKLCTEVIQRIRNDKQIRWVALFFFYFFWIVSMTLLTRTLVESPYHRVMEGWSLKKDAQGNWDFDAFSNLILFIPFVFLLFQAFPTINKKKKIIRIMFNALKISFCFSLFIECWQLFLAIGTFQLADMVYNSVSGVVGGLIYWCCHRRKAAFDD